MHHASCLAGGWYRRPVRIDVQVTADNWERYALRPAEEPIPAGWRAAYTVTAHHADGTPKLAPGAASPRR